MATSFLDPRLPDLAWSKIHLEPVSRHENIVRGIGPELTRQRCAAVAHCPRGHEYTPENTRRTKAGTRSCRACGRERMRELRAARRARPAWPRVGEYSEPGGTR